MEPVEQAPQTRSMEEFFAAHYQPLRRFAYRRLRDHQLAEEIAMDCLVIAWRRGDATEITRAWLFRTAKNRIGDALRKRDRDRRLLGALAHDAALSISVRGTGRISELLQELPPRDRELLEMIYWDELTPSEIAAITNANVSTIWKRTSRAHHRLRALLIDPPPTAPFEEVIGYAVD